MFSALHYIFSKNSVQHPRVERGRILSGVLVLGITIALFLGQAAALNNTFHKKIHHDADTLWHQCIATLIQTGSCESVQPSVTIATVRPPVTQAAVLSYFSVFVCPVCLLKGALAALPPRAP